MTRLPSIATIVRDLQPDCVEDARKIRRIMNAFAHNPRRMLARVNEFMGAHGVEYIQDRLDECNQSYGIEYINQGDSYIPTLCWDRSSGRIFISCWGDIVEKNPRRFGD
jgi:hypothetical protein